MKASCTLHISVEIFTFVSRFIVKYIPLTVLLEFQVILCGIYPTVLLIIVLVLVAMSHASRHQLVSVLSLLTALPA